MSPMSTAPEREPYAVAARQLLRETLFNAARDELQQRSWSEITMADVAAAAGVSRQTLYKEFGSRDEFAQAFVIQEGERFLDGVEAAVREHLDDPRAAINAALETFLRAAGEDPLVRILLSDDGAGGMLPFVTTQGVPVVHWATARLAAVGKVTEDQAKQAGDAWPLPSKQLSTPQTAVPRSYFTEEVRKQLLNETTILGTDQQARYNARVAVVDAPGLNAISLVVGLKSFQPSSQTERLAPFTEPGMIAFRLVDQPQVEPVEVEPVCTHGPGNWGISSCSIVKSCTVAASVPPPGAIAFQWSVRRNVNENRISPE